MDDLIEAVIIEYCQKVRNLMSGIKLNHSQEPIGVICPMYFITVHVRYQNRSFRLEPYAITSLIYQIMLSDNLNCKAE